MGSPTAGDAWGDYLNRKLTIISAPAGYGKTTLLIAWAEHLGLPVAWLSLDEGDNNLTTFIRYFCASLQVIDPSIVKNLFNLIQTDRFSGLGAVGLIEAFQTDLLNRLQSLPHPVVIILDDYQLVMEKTIHQFVVSRVEVDRRELNMETMRSNL